MDLRMPLFFIGLLLLLLSIGCISDRISGQSDICSVHKVEMKKSTVQIVYGLPHKSEFEEAKAAEFLFPHGRDYALGGCMRSFTKTKARIYLCPECVKARKAWLKEKGYDKINTP